jgi:hypothetical protein
MGSLHRRIIGLERRLAELQTIEDKIKRRLRHDDLAHALDVFKSLSDMEKRLASLQRMEVANDIAVSLTSKRLMLEDEIVREAKGWKNHTGVYFLIRDRRVVYVGQSTHISARVKQHEHIGFDSYAFIACDADALDILESLYIYYLQPEHNGNHLYTNKQAPFSFDKIVKMGSEIKKGKIEADDLRRRLAELRAERGSTGPAYSEPAFDRLMRARQGDEQNDGRNRHRRARG